MLAEGHGPLRPWDRIDAPVWKAGVSVALVSLKILDFCHNPGLSSSNGTKCLLC